MGLTVCLNVQRFEHYDMAERPSTLPPNEMKLGSTVAPASVIARDSEEAIGREKKISGFA
jgi:hypothetical protein